MAPRDVTSTPESHGDVLRAITKGIVALLKEFYGRAPTRAKTYNDDDLVVCLLRGGYARVEQPLLEGGRGSSVIQQRMEYQELMRERFESVIEEMTGRRVVGFMSGNRQDPDIMWRSSSSIRPISSTNTRSRRTDNPPVTRRRRRELRKLRTTADARALLRLERGVA